MLPPGEFKRGVGWIALVFVGSQGTVSLVLVTDCAHCRYHAVAPSVESRGNGATTSSSSGQQQQSTTLSGGLSEDEVLRLVWTLSPPDCLDVDRMRRSTWMRPIVGDRELHGGKLLPGASSSFQSYRTAQRMFYRFYLLK